MEVYVGVLNFLLLFFDKTDTFYIFYGVVVFLEKTSDFFATRQAMEQKQKYAYKEANSYRDESV